MSYGNQAWGDAVTAVYTAEQYSRGTKRMQHGAEVKLGDATAAAAAISGSFASQGSRAWVFVKNTEAATAWAKGTCVKRDEAQAVGNAWDGLVSTEAAGERGGILGFAQFAVPAGSYAFIGRSGPFYVIPEGSLTEGESFVSDAGTPGRVKVGTIGTDDDAVLGVALTDDGAAGTAIEGYVTLSL